MQSGDFKCKECGEEFEFKAHCIKHSIETKHQEYDIMATGYKMNIKL